MTRGKKTSSSRKPSRSSKRARNNTPVYTTIVVIVLTVLLSVFLILTNRPPVTDPQLRVRSILSDYGLEFDLVGESPDLHVWKVHTGSDEAVIQSIRQKLKTIPGRVQASHSEKLITEKGGYGLSSEEVHFKDCRIILYFLSDPPPEKEEAPAVTLPTDRIMGAIIIDDIGYTEAVLPFFKRCGVPITASILPGLPRSRKLAERLHEMGVEIMCHIPMQPQSYPRHDPGPGALLLEMGPDRMRELLLRHFQSVPHAVGFNNHMGSAVTADGEAMIEILSTAKSLGYYFVDSRTTKDTVAEFVARRIDVPCLPRDVFLDDLAESSYISKQLAEFEKAMSRKGAAIAIGHPHPATLEILADKLPSIGKHYELVKVSTLMRETHGPTEGR